MDNSLVSAIQQQMNNERYNSQVYFALANMASNLAYDGIASWLRKQAQGEIEHAQKFADFLISKRMYPIYMTIGSISNSTSLLDIVQRAAELERGTTADLKELSDLAEDDAQVEALLDWFLVEQIEEETVTQDLADLVSRSDMAGLYLIDIQYGKL